MVSLLPELLHSPRGGLTTYHGPGQIVLWPVLDIKSPLHKQFTVKCYARLLENTTISTLGRVFGIDAFTTGDPGVWVRHRSHHSQSPSSSSPLSPSQLHPDEDSPCQPPQQTGQTVDRETGDGNEGSEIFKIAALGIHLRRHITALGTALNIAMPGPHITDERVNPWARIVACGLEGRGVTYVAGEVEGGVEGVDELLLQYGRTLHGGEGGDGIGRERAVAGAWAEELARRAGIEDGVEEVDVEEAVRLMERLVEAGEGDGCDDGAEREYLERMRDIVRGR
jgi:lipoyl(octanoyl) transferase